MLNRLKCKGLMHYAIICGVCISIVMAYCGIRSFRDSVITSLVEHTGDKAKAYYLSKLRDSVDLEIATGVLRKATRCYVFDGGTYSGERWFWACTLDSEQACFQLLRQTPYGASVPARPLEVGEMVQYSRDKLLQGIVGPLQFQSDKGPASNHWFPQLVERGCYFLMTDGDRYYMFLIDLDRCRVYECYQS